MYHPLCIPVEERQVQHIILLLPRPTARIGYERIWIVNEVVSPGASSYWGGGTASCAYHPKMSEQAEAPQNASRDNQDHQSNQQCCTHARYPPGLALDRHRWLQRR